mmetsp:Transcript_6762/g.18906  ORF Transcript_6762/g.18906 Transcript_6762/m.18906 type:complete len:318 (+) Transcript_6762:1054-2007(+)
MASMTAGRDPFGTPNFWMFHAPKNTSLSRHSGAACATCAGADFLGFFPAGTTSAASACRFRDSFKVASGVSAPFGCSVAPVPAGGEVGTSLTAASDASARFGCSAAALPWGGAPLTAADTSAAFGCSVATLLAGDGDGATSVGGASVGASAADGAGFSEPSAVSTGCDCRSSLSCSSRICHCCSRYALGDDRWGATCSITTLSVDAGGGGMSTGSEFSEVRGARGATDHGARRCCDPVSANTPVKARGKLQDASTKEATSPAIGGAACLRPSRTSSCIGIGVRAAKASEKSETADNLTSPIAKVAKGDAPRDLRKMA